MFASSRDSGGESGRCGTSRQPGPPVSAIKARLLPASSQVIDSPSPEDHRRTATGATVIPPSYGFAWSLLLRLGAGLAQLGGALLAAHFDRLAADLHGDGGVGLQRVVAGRAGFLRHGDLLDRPH